MTTTIPTSLSFIYLFHAYPSSNQPAYNRDAIANAVLPNEPGLLLQLDIVVQQPHLFTGLEGR